MLLYGDDLGLIRSRAVQAASAVLGGEDDPFRLSVLARHEHDGVLNEARALTLSGGRRVVRVLDVGDALATALARLPERQAGALIILEGGTLPPRSKLRALAEKRSDWAAIACYPASEASVASEIKAAVAQARCTISLEVIQTLVASLPSDTAARDSELQKLITYAGPGGVIDDDALLGGSVDTAERSLSALFEAVMSGQVDTASALVQTAVDDGATGPGVIAAFGTHLQRVLKLRLLVDNGESASVACSRLSPPVFPRQASGLIQQLTAWSSRQLDQLLGDVKIADLACKRAASRDTTIASYLMLVTARRAARSRQ